MGFVSDLLVFAARAAFCIVGVLHALLGAWPEAVGLLPKNDILSKIVPPIVAGLCYTACKPGSEALLPDLNLRVSAQQVLKLGMENNWWSSIEPGASNIEMSECWLLQQGKDEIMSLFVSILPAAGLKGNCLVHGFIKLQSG